MLFIPHKVQVHKNYLKSFLKAGAKFDTPPYLKVNYPFIKQTRQELSKKFTKNITFINSIEGLRKIVDRNISVYESDNHLNKIGYEFISNSILDIVKK